MPANPDAWLRRLGAIPGRMARVHVAGSGESAQLARVRGVLASWRAGVTPGCGCPVCGIMGAAAAEIEDALADETDPLHGAVGCTQATEGAGQ